MRVLVLFTTPPTQLPTGREAGEFELSEAAAEIARWLPDAAAVGVRGHAEEILAALAAHRPDVVFNLCEAPLGRPELEAHAAALFEWAGVPFTGSGSETLALCRRKDHTKAVLASAGVPVPGARGFPCIVKPADQDGSTGLDADSVCADAAAVERARARLTGPVLVEEFLPGTEFVVALWGRADPEYTSVGEVQFVNGLRLFTYAAKWTLDSADYANSKLHYDTPIDPTVRERVTEVARAAWRAVRARGYIRCDVRLDADGHPRVLDVNPNPDVSPDLAMHRAVGEAGWTWERFVRQQVGWAAGGPS